MMHFDLRTWLAVGVLLLSGGVAASPAQDALTLAAKMRGANRAEAELLTGAILRLQPTGPLYMIGLLSLLVEDTGPWRGRGERREDLLKLAERAAGTFPAPGGNWRARLALAIRTARLQFPAQELRLVALVDKLDLWEGADLPFLSRKVLAVNNSRFTTPLIRVLPTASPADRQAFAAGVRALRKPSVLLSTLLYDQGLMRADELPGLLRLLTLEAVFTRVREEPGTWYSPNEERRLRLIIEPLFTRVEFYLRQRLRAGEPLLKNAYDDMRADRGWSGFSLTEDQQSIIDLYLRRLWTGDVAPLGSAAPANLAYFPARSADFCEDRLLGPG